MDEELRRLKPEDRYKVMFLAAKEGRVEDLKYLVERRRVPMSGRSMTRKHLLDLAIQSGSREIKTYILQRGAELKLNYEERKKLMFFACERGDQDLIECMHLQGVEPTVTHHTWPHLKPLHIASKQGHVEVLKYFRSYNVDLRVKDSQGLTPIHYASRYGHLDVIRYLIGEDVNESVKDGDKWTPLHHASWSGRLDTVQLLHKYGADAKARDNKGKRPVDWVGDSTERDAIVAYLTPFSYSIQSRDIDVCSLDDDVRCIHRTKAMTS